MKICDVSICDNPATHTAFDYFTRENWAKNIRESKLTGTVQHGCADHPVYPHSYDVTSWTQPYTDAWSL